MIKNVLTFLSIAVLLSFSQWVCMYFLTEFCFDFTWYGSVKNIFTLGSPVCLNVNKLQVSIAEHYVQLWLGGSISAIVILKTVGM
jgi:hypothetical protein